MQKNAIALANGDKNAELEFPGARAKDLKQIIDAAVKTALSRHLKNLHHESCRLIAEKAVADAMSRAKHPRDAQRKAGHSPKAKDD